MNVKHLGKNVGIIFGMPFYGGYCGDGIPDGAFDEFLKTVKYKYQVAVTADKYQEKAIKDLKENGFRKVITFHSAHATVDEYLTLWTRTLKKSPKELANSPIEEGPRNCSLRCNRNEYMRCSITIKEDNETEKSLKDLKFKRIKNTPVYFRIME